MFNQQTLPPVDDRNLFAGQNLLTTQDLLQTQSALVPGIYPSLTARNPFSIPPFGLSSGVDLGATGALLNPYFLSVLAGTTPWLGGNGFFPQQLASPLLSPPESLSFHKQVEEYDPEEEMKPSETERLLMELTEKESIAVSVLAEFASQRKQQDDMISVRT